MPGVAVFHQHGGLQHVVVPDFLPRYGLHIVLDLSELIHGVKQLPLLY